MHAAGPTICWSHQAVNHRHKEMAESWYFHGDFSLSIHFIISKRGLIPLPFCSVSQANADAFLFCHQAQLLVVFVFGIGWLAVMNKFQKHIQISLTSWWALPPMTFRKETSHCSSYEWACDVIFHPNIS